MSKITLNAVADITQSATAQTTINTNSSTVQTAFDNTLSRDGTSPNQMGANLDMNSNQILNLPSPASANSPVRLQDVTSPAVIASVPPVGTSGAVVGLLNTNNTHSGNNTFSGTNTFNAATTFSGPVTLSSTVTVPGSALPAATSSTKGVVQPDNTTIGVSSGVISAVSVPVTSIGYPHTLDACVRVASPGTAHTYIVAQYGGGNGLWLFSPIRNQFEMTPISGSYTTVDVTNCTLNGTPGQSLSNNTLYYIYANAASVLGGFLTVNHSTTAPTFAGDPFGVLNVTGWAFFPGSLNQRLIGMVYRNGSGNIWEAGTRGVSYNGMSSYYQRQRLNLQLLVTSATTAGGIWGGISGGQALSALVWGDGAEPSMCFSGTVACTSGASTAHIGVSLNGDNPPYDFVQVTMTTANAPYPFSINVSSGDYSNQLLTATPYAFTSAGTLTITNATLTMNLNQ